MFDEQAGAVTRRQIIEAGLTEETVRARLRAGRWRRAFNGVYWMFSGPPSRAATLWATLLTAGRGAAFSHETAAELLGLLDTPAETIHVSLPPDRRVRALPGVRLHHRATAPVAAPGSGPARTGVVDTVVDLTQTAATMDDAISWLVRACGRRMTTPARLRAALEARRRLRWRDALLAAVADVGAGCHSLLELRYLRDVERPHGLPAGSRQQRRRSGRATAYRDVEYGAFRRIVELDGRAAHLDPSRDRWRDNAAATQGWSTLRFGWADVNARPCETAVVVAAALRQGGWTGTPTRCGTACRILDKPKDPRGQSPGDPSACGGSASGRRR
ncbi:type IV toxin-antitoxin system AbiEi family antitoxin domain-containing protein [Dactylosporangium sp. NPDC049525]|uniref:type IV toxin-antitoxin system AbiEi family antitoxin domain-containing protein n=1 Tax=Dactylosporangium sp. NPDC049525 TaxID=3154730 RepID=UPI00343974BB